jgi:bifunctional UDP-N-acetylglucosamine pyrophosphorylase/glucosamine-1-phosphate N-acetyltransferase
MDRPSQAVILAAGASTRTHPLTIDQPKPLLPLLNRPLLEHLLAQLDGLVDEVILVVGFEQEQIRRALGSQYGTLAITYREQLVARGTADALQRARSAIQSRFFMLNGDDLVYQSDLRRLGEHGYGVLGASVGDPSRFGVLEVDEHGDLVQIVEKPTEYAGRPLVSTGAFVFEPTVFEALDQVAVSSRGELEVVDVIDYLPSDERCRVVEAKEAWIPIGYPWRLLEANLYLLGHSTVDPPHFPGVQIRPPVLIGPGSQIESGCRVGPGVTIGGGCRILSGSTIVNSLIMDQVEIGRNCNIQESVIASDVRIADGFETLTEEPSRGPIYSTIKSKSVDTGRARLGVIVGRGAQLGAGSRTAPGVKIWPGVMVPSGKLVQADLFKV